MFNRIRTLEVFGYDIDPTVRRRTNAEVSATGVSKRSLIVIDNCPGCNKERQITLHASRKNRLCPECISKQDYILEARRNQRKEKSEETKAKMRASHWANNGGISHQRGVEQSNEFKAKVSQAVKEWNRKRSPEDRQLSGRKAACTKRGISLDEYEPITTPMLQLRGSPEYKAFLQAVYDRDHRCQYPTCSYGRKSGLTVHHKDGFHWCETGRFAPDNGIVLCHRHHKEFHDVYGKLNNTKEQFQDWIERAKAIYGKKVPLIVIGGASASGKSWVAEQLGDLVSYVSFDKTPKEQHILSVMQKFAAAPDKFVLYDPVYKSSTIVKRYSQVWDVKYVVIVESESVIRGRIIMRGGVPHPANIAKAVARSKCMANMADFSGTAIEVLDHIKKIISNKIEAADEDRVV